jgi:hypothetical protein
MLNYIFIIFLPGSAGNFFSRCINLASDSSYCWVCNDKKIINQTLEEKFKLFEYKNSKDHSNWVQFESKLSHYSNVVDHVDLPPNSFSIWGRHPDYQIINQVAGIDDQKHVFYIDPGNEFEWVVMNSLYKNSYIDSKWLHTGQQMTTDDNIYKIKLADIITCETTLIVAVKQVCDIANIHLKENNKQKIKELWNQWISTTLPKSEFDIFKKSIGWTI